MLGASRIELRLVLELEQKMQRTAQAQLLVEAPVDSRLHGLGASGMTAAAVRPESRPELFRRRSPLQQQLTGVIEDQQRKGAMQNSAPLVALSLAHVADLAVGFIHQNQLGIWRDIVGTDLEATNLIHVRGTPSRQTPLQSLTPAGRTTRVRTATIRLWRRHPVHNSCLPRYSNLSSGRGRPW